jgi:hypothetical protein
MYAISCLESLHSQAGGKKVSGGVSAAAADLINHATQIAAMVCTRYRRALFLLEAFLAQSEHELYDLLMRVYEATSGVNSLGFGAHMVAHWIQAISVTCGAHYHCMHRMQPP